MSKIKLFDHIDKLEKWVNKNKIHVEQVQFFTFGNTSKFMLIYYELLKKLHKKSSKGTESHD